MAVFALTTVSTAAAFAGSAASTNDIVYISRDGVLFSDTDAFGNHQVALSAFGNNMKYYINGEVFGGIDGYAAGTEFHIGSTGRLTTDLFNQFNEASFWNAGVMASGSSLVISKYNDDSDPEFSNDLHIRNSGQIIGGPDAGTYSGSSTIESDGALTWIHNSGEIFGEISAIEVLGGKSVIINTGTITGNVALADTDDKVVNDGLIDGDLDLGEGKNLYVSRGDGLVTGQVVGGDGNDTMKGGAGDDDLFGDRGADSLMGRGGEDTLSGGAGRDTLNGGGGDDTLDGGNGADVFTFRRHDGDDVIVDFQNNSDLIDISAFGLLAADFGSVVTAALSETSNGVLLDFSMMGGSGTVQIDGLTLANADATDFIF
ncbi:MAG: hypothetical protein AAF214_06125 [Pseudomonadota bacterium]